MYIHSVGEKGSEQERERDREREREREREVMNEREERKEGVARKKLRTWRTCRCTCKYGVIFLFSRCVPTWTWKCVCQKPCKFIGCLERPHYLKEPFCPKHPLLCCCNRTCKGGESISLLHENGASTKNYQTMQQREPQAGEYIYTCMYFVVIIVSFAWAVINIRRMRMRVAVVCSFLCLYVIMHSSASLRTTCVQQIEHTCPVCAELQLTDFIKAFSFSNYSLYFRFSTAKQLATLQFPHRKLELHMYCTCVSNPLCTLFLRNTCIYFDTSIDRLTTFT